MFWAHTRFPLNKKLWIANYFCRCILKYTVSSMHFSPHSSIENVCNKVQLQEALSLLSLDADQVKLEDYDLVLTLCVKHRSFREGQRVHAHMIKTRLFLPMYLETRLIVFYTKCFQLEDARYVFDQMRARTVVSWTAMISAYSKKGYHSQALDLFKQMRKSGTSPNEFTFSTVLTSCLGACGFENGRQVHSLVIKSNYESHVFVGSSLLNMYAKAGRILEAIGVFKRLPERDVVSCTAIIAGSAQLGLDEEALEMFRQLLKDGLQPNYVTYASVLTALSGLALLDHGRQVHNRVIRCELPFYVVLENSLIDMYSKCGNLTYSRRVFDNILKRTVITWNAILVGYGKHGLGREVVELYRLMREKREVIPNSVTFMAVLSSCSHGGMVEEGLAIFSEMINGKDGVEPESEHYACVVDLLGRGGRVKEALNFIREMKFEPRAAIWRSLLGACRAHNDILIGEYVAYRLIEIEPQNAGSYVILSNLYASAERWEDVRKVRELMKEKAVAKEPGRSWIGLDHTLHAGDWSHPRKEEIVKKV